jgi:hypothetical protein
LESEKSNALAAPAGDVDRHDGVFPDVCKALVLVFTLSSVAYCTEQTKLAG